MEIGPLFRALWRNRTGPILVAVQVAITLAVLIDAMYAAAMLTTRLNIPVGVDVENVFWISSVGYANNFDYAATVRRDLELLNATPGVVAASAINRVPLSSSMTMRSFALEPDMQGKQEMSAIYVVDERGIDTLGLTLSAGRNFTRDVVAPPKTDYMEALVSTGTDILMTKALAMKLFGTPNAVGKLVYSDSRTLRVVGVIEQLVNAHPWDPRSEYAVLAPAIAPGPTVTYLVRAAPGRRDALMRDLSILLESSIQGRAIDQFEALETTTKRTYVNAWVAIVFLRIVLVLITLVTALGIFSLATFNVVTRTRQIGVRRAVGARKLDILRHFMTENWIITTAGVVVGCVLSVPMGIVISRMLQMQPVTVGYFIGGVLGMWMLGLAATFIPARRATVVSPAMATRTL